LFKLIIKYTFIHVVSKFFYHRTLDFNNLPSSYISSKKHFFLKIILYLLISEKKIWLTKKTKVDGVILTPIQLLCKKLGKVYLIGRVRAPHPLTTRNTNRCRHAAYLLSSLVFLSFSFKHINYWEILFFFTIKRDKQKDYKETTRFETNLITLSNGKELYNYFIWEQGPLKFEQIDTT